jgi:uncharacterized protein (DUF1778 family)
MVKAKTFPIRTTDQWLEEVKKAADKEGKSMHDFVVDAVAEKVKAALEK